MVDLHGQSVIVTGAANGIGRAIALAFAASGANVVVADVLAEDGDRTVATITDDGGSALFVETDVSKAEDARRLVATAVERFGGVDVLVNNAGVGGSRLPVHELEPDDFDRVIDVNLRGTFLCSKYAIPHLLAGGAGGVGRIINTASTYGVIAAPLSAAYCASKAAIINLTRQMAIDYGPQGLRVNALCPGYIDTGLGRRGPTLTPEQFEAANTVRETAAALQPLGRQGSPAEVAGVAVFLASQEASFITGAILPVDGGCITTFNYGAASN
jgi:NAD(P)-dependent dehydrogenase (short-subunit alcohol dehydrogenase family)